MIGVADSCSKGRQHNSCRVLQVEVLVVHQLEDDLLEDIREHIQRESRFSHVKDLGVNLISQLVCVNHYVQPPSSQQPIQEPDQHQ